MRFAEEKKKKKQLQGFGCMHPLITKEVLIGHNYPSLVGLYAHGDGALECFSLFPLSFLFPVSTNFFPSREVHMVPDDGLDKDSSWHLR